MAHELNGIMISRLIKAMRSSFVLQSRKAGMMLRSISMTNLKLLWDRFIALVTLSSIHFVSMIEQSGRNTMDKISKLN